MTLIKQFIQTCKAEGRKKAVIRAVAQVLGLKIVGFTEANEDNELCVKYSIPKACIQPPLFLHSSIKRAMFYEPDKTQKLLNTCFANVLVDYVKTMNALGMETYSSRKAVLEQALVVSGNENYYKHLAYAVKNQWEWEGPTDLLFERCEVLINKWEEKADELSDVYMIYISSLIEKERIEEAKRALSVYVKIYKMQKIHLYYPVAELALEMGITNNKIEKAAYVCKVLCRNKNLLTEYVIGKSVAVVGSGPGEIGKGKGKDIDAHDEVIRFNDFETEGFEEDYGSKTTIWVRNTDIENGGCRSRIKEIEKFSLIVLETDIWRFPIPEMFLDTFYKYAMGARDKFCMLQHRDEMVREMGSFPTSGGLMLYNIYQNIASIKNMDSYGFSLKKNLGKELKHYHDNVYRKSNLHHNFMYEKEYLQRILNI